MSKLANNAKKKPQTDNLDLTAYMEDEMVQSYRKLDGISHNFQCSLYQE